FSIINQIGRTSIKNDMKDSIINHVVNSYLDFIIKAANKNNIDEEVKLNEINKTEALIPKRVRQYASMLEKYEASIFKNDSTKDNRTEIEIMDDLVKILGHIISRRDSERDIFLGMSLFSLFMTLTSDNFMEETINKDLSIYDVKNSELDDAVQDSMKNDFVITKQDDGRICITRK
ncbi:MAG: hypothetical protein QMD11_12490, partial [Smithella sp.]|nr:hypothetical protein [Smithella sp.]